MEIDRVHLLKPEHIWNRVIFFPDENFDLNDTDSPTNQLLNYFKEARISIQVCIYLASFPQIEEVISDAKDEGKLVQIVTDHDTSHAHNNYSTTLWRRNGIEVRSRLTGFLMHHKFAIIDEVAVLTGSLNWTKQGFCHNNENVMITTDKRIVSQFIKEFRRLWTSCGEAM